MIEIVFDVELNVFCVVDTEWNVFEFEDEQSAVSKVQELYGQEVECFISPRLDV
jgi:hypothetical protein